MNFPNASAEFLKLNPGLRKLASSKKVSEKLKHECPGLFASEGVQDSPAGPPDSGSKPPQRPALEQVLPAKEGHDARPVVRITGYRVRWLDVDAFPGSCKAIIDGLRACNLIPGDSPKDIILQTDQIKVAHYAQEKTEVVIIYP